MGRIRSLLIPGVDKQLLVRDATNVMPDLARRRFIAGGASFGALTLLTGCDVSDSFSAEEMLKRISKFNDGVQAAIFNPNALAPTFPESAITRPFPFNGYYDQEDAPNINGADWKLEVRGLVDNKKSWTLEELYKLPQVKQVTRHIGHHPCSVPDQQLLVDAGDQKRANAAHDVSSSKSLRLSMIFSENRFPLFRIML